MKDVLLTPIRLNELEVLIQNSVEKAFKYHSGTNDKLDGYSDHPLTVKQAADFLNLTRATIYSKVSRGELPYNKQGKQLYFLRNELIDYVKKGRIKTNAEIEAEAGNYLKNKKEVNHGR